MKYANIILDKGCISNFCYGQDSERVVNIGDHIQLLAINHLYDTMGIAKEEIVDIEYYELMDYDGEYVVLPINLILFNPFFGERPLKFSPKIIPVFLGVSYNNQNPDKEELEYLKMYAPIGCRDEYTMKLMRSLGVPAYLNGCMSLTLPKRHIKTKGQKVYFVDAPDSLIQYVPHTLKENGVFMTHQYYGKFGESIAKKPIKEFAREQFELYKRDASLIVTSRLHCAAPCIAMGIPVVFAVDTYQHSYGWMEKLIPIYMKENFHKINWYPECVECEEIKTKMLQTASKKISKVVEEYESMYNISNFFESRDKQMYVHSQLGYLEQHGEKYWNKSDEIKYALWGVTMSSSAVVSYMRKEYPNSKLVAVFDNYRNFIYEGLQTIKTEQLPEYEDCCIIVTGDSASIAAAELFLESGRPECNYCLCFQSKYEKKTKI